jgi:anti-sigma B factor antagonist
LENSPQFKEEVYRKLSEDHKNVILDFSDVEFIDSSGIGSIISILKAVNQRKGILRILNPRSEVRRIFNMVRMDQLVPIVNTMDDAIIK